MFRVDIKTPSSEFSKVVANEAAVISEAAEYIEGKTKVELNIYYKKEQWDKYTLVEHYYMNTSNKNGTPIDKIEVDETKDFYGTDAQMKSKILELLKRTNVKIFAFDKTGQITGVYVKEKKGNVATVNEDLNTVAQPGYKVVISNDRKVIYEKYIGEYKEAKSLYAELSNDIAVSGKIAIIKRK